MSVPTYTSKSALGAASELIASAHLMAQGYHVFRALAPTCPVDLVAYRDGELLKVEVKSVTVDPDARTTPCFNKPTNDQWDLLVLVLTTGDALTLVPRDTYEELRLDFLSLLEPLGLVKSWRGRTFNGGRRYRSETPTRGPVAHLIDASRPYATTACGQNASSWRGEKDAIERARAAALPLCKTCARFVQEAS